MKKITVYSKDYCPYCDQAKQLLSELGVVYNEIDITQTPETIHKLVEKSGLMTVPQIFVDEDGKELCLGGYDDIYKLHQEGKLKDLLGL